MKPILLILLPFTLLASDPIPPWACRQIDRRVTQMEHDGLPDGTTIQDYRDLTRLRDICIAQQDTTA